MHGVASAVGAWLDAGLGVAGAARGEALAFARDGRSVGGLLGGAVDDVARRLVGDAAERKNPWRNQ